VTTIMIVDDEPLVRQELGELLTEEGYDIVTAEDGEAGLEAFLRYRPEMVITDAKMPRREGLSLARAILADDASVAITMITGHGTEKMAIEALRLGITDFIKKPLNINDLLAAVERMQNARALTKRPRTPLALPDEVRRVGATVSYELDNSRDAVPALVTAVVHDMASPLPNRKRDGLALALRELLLNGIEHGNLQLGFESKTTATDQGQLEAVIQQRLAQAELAQRKVHIEARQRPEAVTIVITDEGEGFDWQALPDPTEPDNILCCHGRGVLLAQLSVDELVFTPPGNQVTITCWVGTPPALDG
jgi:DNA-binding response OmpR family regulator